MQDREKYRVTALYADGKGQHEAWFRTMAEAKIYKYECEQLAKYSNLYITIKGEE